MPAPAWKLFLLAAGALAMLPAWADPASAPAPSDWLQIPTVQQRLAAGEVVDRSVLDEHDARASVDAAIQVHAAAQAVWPLISDCRNAALLIPGLKRCRLLQSAADGSWAVIEHEIKYSLLTPLVHSVFRADFQPPYIMRFHRLSGDLKYEVGTWILRPAPDGTTIVEYQVAMQPAFWVPRALVRHSLRKQLPAALVALRERAEASISTPVAASAPVASPSAQTPP